MQMGVKGNTDWLEASTGCVASEPPNRVPPAYLLKATGNQDQLIQ